MQLPRNRKIPVLVEPELARLVRSLATISELLMIYLVIWGVYTALTEIATWI